MKPETVHLYVLNTLADWEPGMAVARINNPAFQAQPGRYRVETVGLTRNPVTTMGGVTILPDLTLEELRPQLSAMLILPGGDTWDQGQNIEAARKAQEFLAAGVPVAAICGATSGLARVGVLDDRRHTSNSPDYLQATGYQGAKLYQNEPAVTDGLLITASGVASLDFAYHILRYLEVYDQPALDAWYGLFKTGDPTYYSALMAAIGA
jgi:putative intracellular protease/amidase